MKLILQLALLFGMSLPLFAGAVESLDPDFGKNGQLTTEFSIYDDKAHAVAIQADGKILVAGWSENGADTDIALARYNSDGTLDTDFNYSGQVTVAVGSGDDRGFALLVQEDGKILVAGTTNNGDDLDVALIRLHGDGLLDMDFSDDGQVVIPLQDSDDKAYAVLLQEDGKIILAGVSEGTNSSQLFLARLNDDGSLDPTFADQDLVSGTDSSDSAGFAATLREDGRILVAGFAEKEEVKQAALFSFLASGQADQTFGEQGIAYSGTEEDASRFYDLELLDNGSILAVGGVSGSSYGTILLAGFTAEGAPSPHFGEQGMVQTDLGIDAIAYDLALAADSTIYLAGSGSRDEDTDFILLHYSASGQLSEDSPTTTEGEEGHQTASDSLTIGSLQIYDNIESWQDYTLTDFAEYDDVAHSLVIQDNGAILLAGSAGNGKDYDFALLRFSTADLAASYVEHGLSTQEGYYIATVQPDNVTRNSATSGGFLQKVATWYSVEARGVCYGITSNPGLKDFSDTDAGDNETTTDGDEESGDSTVAGGLNPFKVSTVREGCTSDGSGEGWFRSDILDITPDSTYYVRAYATLTSDNDNLDNVTIYGNELQFTTKDACFIATAAHGDIDNIQVRILRDFRDSFLKPSSLGRSLVKTYYRVSPPLAEMISEQPLLQLAVRVLLAPITILSSFALYPLPGLLLGALFLLSLGLLHLALRRKHGMHRNLLDVRGFTLIELLVVLVIIGILAGYVGPRIMGHPEDAKRTMAAAQMSALETAIESYKLDNGAYPSTEQGLQALVEPPSQATKWRKGGYMKKGKVPKDPWGNDYIYLSPGTHSDFDIISYGADNESGGEDANSDINNWEIE